MSQAQAKVLGPFEIIQETGPEGRAVVTIPFTRVRGSNLIVTAEDNFARVLPGTTLRAYWATAEVAICGMIQGAEFVLKRQHVRALTGPMGYVFEDAEAYDQVVIRGRNMSGGRRGPPGFAMDDPSAANGFSLRLQIVIQPRGGIGPSKRFEGMG